MGVVGTGVERVQHVESMPGVEQVDPRQQALQARQRASTIPTGPSVRVGNVASGPERPWWSWPDPARSSRASSCSRRRAGSSARAPRSCAAARSSHAPPRTRSRASDVEGLKLLAEAREETGPAHRHRGHRPRATSPLFEQYVDMLQVGARNMHNFVLLKAVGQSRKPVLLKRGLSATIEEWLMAAEYILAGGQPQRHPLRARHPHASRPPPATRSTSRPCRSLRERTHLPVMVDPSHGTGHRSLVRPMAVAGAAAGPTGSSSRSTPTRPGRSRTPSSRSPSRSSAT